MILYHAYTDVRSTDTKHKIIHHALTVIDNKFHPTNTSGNADFNQFQFFLIFNFYGAHLSL